MEQSTKCSKFGRILYENLPCLVCSFLCIGPLISLGIYILVKIDSCEKRETVWLTIFAIFSITLIFFFCLTNVYCMLDEYQVIYNSSNRSGQMDKTKDYVKIVSIILGVLFTIIFMAITMYGLNFVDGECVDPTFVKNMRILSLISFWWVVFTVGCNIVFLREC